MLNMKATVENKVEVLLILSWINKKDLFWIKDLREAFPNTDPHAEPGSPSNLVRAILNKLRQLGVIQCCEVKGRERKYIRLRKATIDDIYRY
jgi:hypothetical protein